MFDMMAKVCREVEDCRNGWKAMSVRCVGCRLTAMKNNHCLLVTRMSNGCDVGGLAEIRTPVRTRKSYAFYMLISAFGFRAIARPEPPTIALSSKSHTNIEAYLCYFRFTCTAGSSNSEQHSWSDVSFHLSEDGIKPIIYYASIRQRERNCFRQLIFVHSDYRESKRVSACLHTIPSCRQIHSSP